MLTCPHCGAAYAPGQRFCESCGKAVPAAAAGGPRVVGDAPTSGAGYKLAGDELLKQQKKASTALLIVAVLQTLGTVLMAVLANVARSNVQIDPLDVAILGAVAAGFWGLWWWSRSRPLPAAITGLVVFLTLHLIAAVVDPKSIVQGILIKIIVVVLLVSAIQAGIKYRRLTERGAYAA